jgi:hypothetical protein
MLEILLSAIFFLSIYFRKIISYFEVFPNFYFYEFIFLIITIYVFCKFNVKKFVESKLLFLYVCMIILALFILLLALFKISNGGSPENYKEVGILLYPFYWSLLLLIFNNADLGKLNTYSNHTILVFPIFLSVLIFFGIYAALVGVNIILWPNNNMILTSCLLALTHKGKKPLYNLSIISSLFSILNLLIEAQRGAFLILVFGFITLIKDLKNLLIFFLVLLSMYLLVDFYGSELSVRFENGSSDFLYFINAILGDSDIRYSSSETRMNMWLSVVNQIQDNAIIFFSGLPIDQTIVSEAWRTPHNGYLSAIARGGILTLLFYLFLLYDSFLALLYTRRSESFSLCHYIYFACCIDALTQTVFDSPYSLFILIFSSSLSIAIRNKAKFNTHNAL